MNKLINIPVQLTADQFSCDPDHFRQHVRGRMLPVTEESAHFVTVLDATGETWTVNKAALNPKKNDEEVLEADFKQLK